MKQLATPEDILTNYEYDSHDNLIVVTDGNRNTTEYFYDDFRRLHQTLSPDTGKTTYLYDETGNLVQKTDQRGTVATYTYDPMNRLTSKNFAQDPSQDIIYTYDSPLVSYGIGRLTGRSDPSGSYNFHYDSNGNLTKEVKQIGNVTYTTKYGYNKNNTLTSITYPSGRIITYIPDEIDRVSKVSTGVGFRAKSLASSISYLPFGGLTGFSYGNGLPLSHSHDYQYRISSIAVNSLFNRIYEHDPNGNVTSITDSLNPSWNQPQERPETYTYELGTNRLSQVAGEIPITFGYDPNGNTASENTRIYEYDYSNRPTKVKENDTTLAEYVYNGAGQRIMKILPSEIRIFHYDFLGHLIAETTETGHTIAEYVYLRDQLLTMLREGNTYYFHNDHLGTPQILTDSAGKVVWKAAYNAFGETTILVEEVENPFRFPGQYYDKETGLHYNYFRDYNPSTGRYMTPDPIGLLGGINPFVYVANNSVNFVDLFGLDILLFNARRVYWINEQSQIIGNYPAISGPFGSGSLPEGSYTGENLRTRTKEGMNCPSGGWSLDLNPNFPTDRSLLRVHPDEPPAGTQGCIGVDCSAAGKLYKDLGNYFGQGNSTISVQVNYNFFPFSYGGIFE